MLPLRHIATQRNKSEKSKMAHRFRFTDFPRAEKGEKIEFDGKWMQYLVYQLEKCPDTGKLHYQGFLYMIRKMRYNTVLKRLGGHLALFHCDATAAENISYATKADTRVDGTY